MSQVAWVASCRRHCHFDIITHAKYVELYVYILSDIDLGIIWDAIFVSISTNDIGKKGKHARTLNNSYKLPQREKKHS